MNEINPSIKRNPEKPCVLCSLNIPATAKVCTHCNAEQSALVRRFKRAGVVLGAMAAVLPLVYAMISITTSVREMATGKYKADVRFRIVACRPSSITVAAMNFGKGPAVIGVGSPSLRIRGAYLGDVKANSSITLHANAEQIVLRPSGALTIPLTGMLDGVQADLPLRSGTDMCSYEPTLIVDDAYASTPWTGKCDCPA
jgi:predicted nucleic acid-binding Zn ribbon protein